MHQKIAFQTPLGELKVLSQASWLYFRGKLLKGEKGRR